MSLAAFRNSCSVIRNLQDIIAILGIDELSDEDKAIVPGPDDPQLPLAAVPRRRSLLGLQGHLRALKRHDPFLSRRSFRGEYDSYPEAAFLYCGTIEDVEKKAKESSSIKTSMKPIFRPRTDPWVFFLTIPEFVSPWLLQAY
jgi:F0F1-type ATP synthase beta subunit